MEALANGCPNLVKVKVKKCRAVTYGCADLFRIKRGSLAVNLDSEHQDASAGDGVVQENIGFTPISTSSCKLRQCLATATNPSSPIRFAFQPSI
ncbi:hypothetical protein OIU85_028323 [Salix viminalis]|uniref:Uncharacterized protein n=1 Tax=Salix viminalis TaxID=40686 RepID=A0A9Q0TB48_SALVM|nr:hypothetical protein OIU85_028323 [Salix viminalis]